MTRDEIVQTRSGKRDGYISWDDYFMSVAFLTAMRSKDPSTQVGACIVNDQNRIVGVGYNGFPSGIPDEALPWGKEAPGGDLDTKHPYVCHAELNAVLNKNAESCRNCVLYSTLYPCNECAKVIIQAGIRRVIYASDKHRRRVSTQASQRLFSLAGVETRQHQPGASELRILLRYREDEPLPEPGSQEQTPPASPLKTAQPLMSCTPDSAINEIECQLCETEDDQEPALQLSPDKPTRYAVTAQALLRHVCTHLTVGLAAVLLSSWLRRRNSAA